MRQKEVHKPHIYAWDKPSFTLAFFTRASLYYNVHIFMKSDNKHPVVNFMNFLFGEWGVGDCRS